MNNSVEGSRSNEASLLLRPPSTPIINDHDTPTYRKASVSSCAVICILFVEMCERLTFFGISANLVLFATKDDHLRMSPESASILAFVFAGTCYVMPVIAGWLADSKFGRFSVILFSAVVYLIGTILLPIGSITYKHDEKSDWAANSVTTNTSFKRTVYITGLFLVAFGTGGIKANVAPFGADQVSNLGPRAIQAFFSWFYWFISIGALLAYTFVVYMQQNVSYFYGNLIPACSLVLALFIFLAGQRTYCIRPSTGSVLSTTLKIAAEAITKSQHPALSTSLVNHWLDRAKVCFGGSYSSREVDDVKKVFRLLPLFGTFILYWTVYAQMSTAVIYQGKYMDIRLGSSFKIPVASLTILNTLELLILVPIMDKIVYPLLAKYNILPSQLQRIGTGMLFCSATMAYAGGIEWFRIDHCCILQDRGDKNLTEVSSISIFYQAPTYFLIGLSDVYTNIAGFELAYTEAPESLQGVVMGIFLLTIGLGTYAGAALVAIVNAISGASDSANKWYPDKDQINEGHHLSYYFFLLAGLTFLNSLLYFLVAVSFKAKKESANRTNSNARANELPKYEKRSSLPLPRDASTDNAEHTNR